MYANLFLSVNYKFNFTSTFFVSFLFIDKTSIALQMKKYGSQESLYQFRAGLEGLDVSSFGDPMKQYDILGFIISDFLTLNDDEITSEYVKTSLNHPHIRMLLKQNLDSLSYNLKGLQSNPLYSSFAAFLKEQLQWPEEKMLDFKSILETLFDSKYFSSIMLKTAEYIL